MIRTYVSHQANKEGKKKKKKALSKPSSGLHQGKLLLMHLPF